MNCWFCNNPINLIRSKSVKYSYDIECPAPECHKHGVIYKCVTLNVLDVVQFHTSFNERNYFINYWVTVKYICVTKQSLPRPDAPFSYESVLQVPYTSITLTPTNSKNKLSLLLLLS